MVGMNARRRLAGTNRAKILPPNRVIIFNLRLVEAQETRFSSVIFLNIIVLTYIRKARASSQTQGRGYLPCTLLLGNCRIGGEIAVFIGNVEPAVGNHGAFPVDGADMSIVPQLLAVRRVKRADTSASGVEQHAIGKDG